MDQTIKSNKYNRMLNHCIVNNIKKLKFNNNTNSSNKNRAFNPNNKKLIRKLLG